MLGIKRAKTAETGVDQPQFILCIPAKLVNIDVASDVDAARNVTCVMLAGRLQFLRHGRHVVVFPDGVAATDGQPGIIGGNTHRFGEGSEIALGCLHPTISPNKTTSIAAVRETRCRKTHI